MKNSVKKTLSRADVTMMGLIQYEAFVDSMRIPAKHYDDRIEMLLALPGEVGEFLDHFKKYVRDGTPIDRDEALDELGDVLFSVVALASMLDSSAVELIEINTKKLEGRRLK